MAHGLLHPAIMIPCHHYTTARRQHTCTHPPVRPPPAPPYSNLFPPPAGNRCAYAPSTNDGTQVTLRACNITWQSQIFMLTAAPNGEFRGA